MSLRFITAVFGLAIGVNAVAVPLNGELTAPAGTAPAMRVYAWSSNGALHWVAVRQGEPFHLELPAGRYRLFAAPADPGAPSVYAGHTECDPRAACEHHSLRWLRVESAAVRADIVDWHLDEADALSIDQRLGRSEADATELDIAAPKFIEYPAITRPAARAQRLAPESPVDGALRDVLQTALVNAAPNVGGRGVLVQNPCPHGCEAALVDLPTGRVLRIPHAAGTVAYRRDSRLLVVSLPDASRHYYVWDPEPGTLRPVGEPRSGLGSEAAY